MGTGKIVGPGAPERNGEAQQLAESLLDNLSSGLLMVDSEGTVCYMNQKAERILQISRNEFVGKRVYMLPLRTPIYKVLSENCRDSPVEMSINGQVIQAKATSVICREGACLGEMYELRDITPERRAQRQSDEFVASMTHDLKSPLTVILGYVDALDSDQGMPGSKRTNDCLLEIRRNGYRLQGMIEDILDSYRLDVGLVEIRRDYCDVGKILEKCCQELARDAEEHRLKYSYSIDPEIPILKADGKQLSRVFANLIGNAIKFTPRDGSVVVEAGFTDAEVVITVSDTGIGIPARDQERIFNKYFRSDQVRGYKGTGLCLTICKALTEEHGGSVEAASSEGAGSRFTVRLPVQSLE